jgi:hypothetical protein
MHPRNKVLALLAVNGLLLAAISWRFVHVHAAWDAWATRNEMRAHLQKSAPKR